MTALRPALMFHHSYFINNISNHKEVIVTSETLSRSEAAELLNEML